MLRLAARLTTGAGSLRLASRQQVLGCAAHARLLSDSSPSQPLSEELRAVLSAHDLPEDSGLTNVDPAVLQERVRFLELLGVKRGATVGGVLRREPSLLEINLEEVAVPRIDYLISLGVHQIGRVVAHAPRVLLCDIDQLHEKVQLLQVMGVKHIAKWITDNAAVVIIDIETQMKPAVLYWRSIENLDLGKIIALVPVQYSFAPPEVTAKKLKWLQEELGMLDIGKILTKAPKLLTLNLETGIIPKVEFLRSNGFGDSIGKLLQRCPRLLLSSIELALEPRLKYVLNDMGRSIDDILIYPQILIHPIPTLKKRHRFLKLKGKFDNYSLARIFRATDHKMALLGECTLLEYEKFEPAPDGEEDKIPVLLDPNEHVPSPTERFIRVYEGRVAKDEARRVACGQLREAIAVFFRADSSADAASPDKVSPTNLSEADGHLPATDGSPTPEKKDA
ncbi:hypothetical protein AB1Y20_017753 [Prymnesium parvum]|uniref:Uncharacterized protein n=1 Tax=Prymnesium parvum TaxID=97485 RepID=A0AB34JQB2_PRYPA